MILRRISYSLAFQFTAFVFGLLLVTGTVFLASDLVQRRGEADMRLQRQLTQILERPNGVRMIPALPPFQRERIRIVDTLGKVLFSGALYQELPFKWQRRLTTVDIGGESYDILTAPYLEDGEVVGYVQVADRSPRDDLQQRVFLFLVVSAGISALTFGVGLFFARRSLRPAQEMMDRLEQFTQDASHELRNPLTAVGTSLDLALATKDESAIRDAKKGLKDVTTLVERLLELARLDAFVLAREQVDASSLVNAVLDAHQADAERKGVTIERAIEPGVTLQADAPLAKQVVANLVSNAIKFNKEGGTVAVTLTKDQLTVRDTGAGISPQALEKIYDRFFREDAARSKAADGLGLGLALAKRVCDLHGWSIDAESEPGDGATFTVRF